MKIIQRAVKLALILLQQKTVKLAAIFLQQKNGNANFTDLQRAHFYCFVQRQHVEISLFERIING